MAPFSRNGAVTRDKAGHIRELIPSMDRGWVGWQSAGKDNFLTVILVKSTEKEAVL